MELSNQHSFSTYPLITRYSTWKLIQITPIYLPSHEYSSISRAWIALESSNSPPGTVCAPSSSGTTHPCTETADSKETMTVQERNGNGITSNSFILRNCLEFYFVFKFKTAEESANCEGYCFCLVTTNFNLCMKYFTSWWWFKIKIFSFLSFFFK